MESDDIEFKACRCGTEPDVIDMRSGGGFRQVGVQCPKCGLSNFAAWGGETGMERKDALRIVADSWNIR